MRENDDLRHLRTPRLLRSRSNYPSLQGIPCEYTVPTIGTSVDWRTLSVFCAGQGWMIKQEDGGPKATAHRKRFWETIDIERTKRGERGDQHGMKVSQSMGKVERDRSLWSSTQGRAPYFLPALKIDWVDHRLISYTDPAATWGCEISSLHRGWIVGREAKPAARLAASKVQGRFIRSHRATQNQLQILEPVPRLC